MRSKDRKTRIKIISLIGILVLLVIIFFGSPRIIRLKKYKAPITEYSVKLLQDTYTSDENTWISPLLTLSDLAKEVKSADKDRIQEIEQEVGMTEDELKNFVHTYKLFTSLISNKRSGVDLSKETVFEGVWDWGYWKGGDFEFIKNDGNYKHISDVMNANLELYYEDESTCGFVRYFRLKRFAFAMLMPKEDISLDDYIKNLNPDKLVDIIKKCNSNVDVSIPMFSYSNIVLDEDGVNTEFKADTTVSLDISAVHNICANRPFLYIIMDCEYNIPIVMGTVVDP